MTSKCDECILFPSAPGPALASVVSAYCSLVHQALHKQSSKCEWVHKVHQLTASLPAYHQKIRSFLWSPSLVFHLGNHRSLTEHASNRAPSNKQRSESYHLISISSRSSICRIQAFCELVGRTTPLAKEPTTTVRRSAIVVLVFWLLIALLRKTDTIAAQRCDRTEQEEGQLH